MFYSLLHLLLMMLIMPASLVLGALIGKGIQQLLPSKSDTPVALCAIIAVCATGIILFGGGSSQMSDQDRWFRP